MLKMEIQNIIYNRKTVDRGVILGSVSTRFCATMNKTPCKLKHGRRLLSKITRHRENPRIYVPLEFLEGLEGQEFEFISGDGESYPWRHVWRLEYIGSDFVAFQEIGRQQILPKARARVETGPRIVTRSAEDLWFVPADNVSRPREFVDAWRPVDRSPMILTRAGRIFLRKTEFCFRYAPENKHLTGSRFQKIVPDEIRAQSFLVQGQEFDLLTGLPCPVPESCLDRVSPRYREISAAV